MVYSKYALNAYTQTMIETTNPLEHVILLYDGAIESLNRAIVAIRGKEVQSKIKNLNKAMVIVEGLLNSLNPDMCGEGSLALNLQELYLYMMRELTLANTRNDEKRIDHITGILKELREAWVQVKNGIPGI